MAPRTNKDVRELEIAFLTCRVRRHVWEDIPDDGGIKRQWVASRTVVRLKQRCTRCGTERSEAWNAITGEIIFASYTYPQNYKLITNGSRAGINQTLRKEFLKRR